MLDKIILYMPKWLKIFINTQEKKRLFSNFISLSVLQAANYLLPLVTFPYLVRVLGVEKFGLLSFAQATIAYFNIIVDYGFNLTATREISIHRDNKEKVTEIFSSVMIIKSFFIFISLSLLALLVFSFEKFRNDALIYILTFGTVIGNALFPVWFFQGMEHMKWITYLNILAKLIFTIAIFIFVHSAQDLYKVPILNSLGFLVAGILSLRIVVRQYKIHLVRQKYTSIRFYIKEATNIFVSNVAISLYTVSTTFILGLFTNHTIVGYYAAADKIIQAFKGLMAPVSQAIYPFIAKKVSESKELGLYFIRKVSLYVAIFTGSISVFIFIFAKFLVDLILGYAYLNSIVVLKIMSILPFMIGLSNIFGIQTMLNYRKNKAFRNILLTGSFLNLALSIFLVPIFMHIGSAISVLIVETFITIAMLTYLQSTGLKIIGKLHV